MLGHAARLLGLAIVLGGCVILPFLPGNYDRLAAPLATMVLLFGYAGLPMAAGAAWLVSEFRRRSGGRDAASQTRALSRSGYRFALAAIACGALAAYNLIFEQHAYAGVHGV